MTLIDTHCHLDDVIFDHNRTELLVQATQLGVSGYIVPSASIQSLGRVKMVCRQHPCCFPAYGIHPYYLDGTVEQTLGALEEALLDGSAVAIGEIGIDLYDGKDAIARQSHYFCAQLDIARRHHLPVLLHMRRSIDQVIPMLRRYKIDRGVAHAFSGSIEQAKQLIGLGLKIGFGGVVTYPNAHKIRLAAVVLPEDAIVLETDAPFLPPIWLQKQTNSPIALPAIADVIASLRGIPTHQLAEITTRNANQVFGLDEKTQYFH